MVIISWDKGAALATKILQYGRVALNPTEMDTGNHIIEWNARDYPSGVYAYRLTTNGTSKVRMIIILK